MYCVARVRCVDMKGVTCADVDMCGEKAMTDDAHTARARDADFVSWHGEASSHLLSHVKANVKSWPRRSGPACDDFMFIRYVHGRVVS